MEEICNVQIRELGDDMSLDHAKSYLSKLAAMHAHYWNNHQLLDLEWLGNNTARREQIWGSMMKMI